MEDDRFHISKLLHPSLLTVNELCYILQSYCIKTEPNLSKDELVDVFKRVAMPLPQRVYGKSWRERLLDKKRSKRKITLEPECNQPKSRRLSHGPESLPTNRLKPPPSASSGSEKTVIRISSTKKAKADDPPPVNGKHKRIRIDFSDASEKSTPIPRVISSKRPSK